MLGAQAPAQGSESQPTSVIAVINTLRRKLGLPPFQTDPSLMASAASHSRYRAMNPMAGESWHSESRSRDGFSGADPFERMRAHGYRSAPAAENGMSFSGLNGDALECWLAAPYHRIPLLHPAYRDIGIGFSAATTRPDWYATANFGFGATGGVHTPTVVCYPGEGQTGVPLVWDTPEAPDPLRLHGGRRPVGYVISFSYFSNSERRLQMEEASLTTADGKAVECFLNHPDNDSALQANTILLIPQRPLRRETVYRARVSARMGSERISRDWTFTTAGPDQARSVKRGGPYQRLSR